MQHILIDLSDCNPSLGETPFFGPFPSREAAEKRAHEVHLENYEIIPDEFV